MGVVPGGSIVYKSDFDDPGYFIRKLTPEDRVLSSINGNQTIVGDPAYFTVRTPRAFAHAKVTVKYKNSDNIPIIEAGVLADKKVWRYQTKPLENKNLDELTASWPAIRQGQTTLWQKQKKFATIEAFLNNLPNAKSIAVYNYNLSAPFQLGDYWPTTTPKNFNYPIRGPFQFYTYIKDEALSFQFFIIDLNRNKDADPVELKLWQGNSLIKSVGLTDDGIEVDSGRVVPERRLELKAANLSEGAYRVEVVSNDDIVVKRIVTPQSKLSFINKVWFADRGKVPIILDTDSQAVNIQTLNPAKFSQVRVGQNKVDINETYRQYSVITSERITSVVLPQDDMIISGDGVFSIAGDGYINPSFMKVGPDFYPGQRGIEYVIADYQSPQSSQDDWQIATADFDLGSSVYREFYKYGFMISLPGVKAEEQPQRKLILNEIVIEFSGSSLWSKIKNSLYGK